MLEVKGLAKSFGEFSSSDISFEIAGGEYFVLLGPSGVGKTVLIEMIAGLIRPDAGQVFWNGQDITNVGTELRRFSVVYQDFALFNHMSVAKNISYGLRIKGADQKKIAERTTELAETLAISKLLDRKPAKLSSGEKQRVALARALAAEPAMLLLDEPLSALDTNTRFRLRKELKQISRKMNIPILQTTHDPEEAISLGDTAAVMLDGSIRQVSSCEELFRRPSDPDVAAFLGIANVLPVSSMDEKNCIVMGQKIRLTSDTKNMDHIWIRPEEIILSLEKFDSSARNQLKCTVTGWDNRDPLLAVELKCSNLELVSFITYQSFNELNIKAGSQVYATFKSSAIHCL